MRRYAPLQYQQVLLRAPTAALYCISNPTTASTFALACCDDFCQRRAKLYLTYCKRAFGKPQSGKSAQQARANAYFFRRSVACIGNSSTGPLTQSPHFGALLIKSRPSQTHFIFNHIRFKITLLRRFLAFRRCLLKFYRIKFIITPTY